MWQLLKSIFGQNDKRKFKKKISDAKFGTLVNEYEEGDKTFTWMAEVNNNREDKEPISVTIDGDFNKPYPETLNKAYQLVESIPDLAYQVQKELDWKFSEKKINLSRDFRLDDIYVYLDDDDKTVCFELEYFTENNDVLISVEFINDEIKAIDFY
jgi:hypothetical protein